MKYRYLTYLIVCFSSVALTAHADEIKALVTAQCGSCHAFNEVDYARLSLAERAERKAPPLYYAGNKFRKGWLVDWLQHPVRIRPAGYFPPSHTVAGKDGDVIDTETLAEHVSVKESDAIKFADYLMSLKPYTARIEAVDYTEGSISWKMGNLNFGKFNGCDACHRDAPDYGGLSGPELYTSWQRLQPKFIASYITDPVAWDPHTLMPHKDINPAVVKKLTDYLKVNGEDQP
ncbi:MAG: hypothetical protein WCY88_16460 [Spongiibacteraceae bacterium]